MKTRPCSMEDFSAVIQLLHQLWPDRYLDSQRLKDTFQLALQTAQQRLHCATIDSNVVDFCSLSVRHSLWCQQLLAHVDSELGNPVAKLRVITSGRRLVDSSISLSIRWLNNSSFETTAVCQVS